MDMRMVFLKKKGIVISEYTVFVSIILLAALFMYLYLFRGISGSWKKSIDTIGFERLYDTTKTKECAYSALKEVWYDVKNFEACETEETKKDCLDKCDNPFVSYKYAGDVACFQKCLEDTCVQEDSGCSNP